MKVPPYLYGNIQIIAENREFVNRYQEKFSGDLPGGAIFIPGDPSILDANDPPGLLRDGVVMGDEDDGMPFPV